MYSMMESQSKYSYYIVFRYENYYYDIDLDIKGDCVYD